MRFIGINKKNGKFNRQVAFSGENRVFKFEGNEAGINETRFLFGEIGNLVFFAEAFSDCCFDFFQAGSL
jgi:hypothetical protein